MDGWRELVGDFGIEWKRGMQCSLTYPAEHFGGWRCFN